MVRRPWTTLIRGLHSLVLLAMLAAITYVVFSAVSGRRDTWLWLSIGVVLVEGAVYLAFGRRCPLTMWAKHLGDETGHDLLGAWLLPPSWLRRVVPVSGAVFALGLVWLVVATLGGR